jgi:hypothetical protein
MHMTLQSAGAWRAMRGFCMVTCAATTMLMSDDLVAAMTLLVGFVSTCPTGLHVGLPLLWSRSCGCGWTCGDDALWQVVRWRWTSLPRVLHISSFGDLHQNWSCQSLCEESSIWHQLTWASWGRCGDAFLGGRSSVKSESLAHGGVMMTTPTGNLDNVPCLQWCVRFAFGSQGDRVCPRDGRVPWRSLRAFVSVFDRSSAN